MRNAALVMFCLATLACGKVKGTPPNDVTPDPCETNVCECTVASQNLDCPGAHQICDEVTTPGRVCGCAPAYKDDGSGNCVFDAAPLNSGFQETGTWEPVGAGATISTAASGSVDPGQGVMNRQAICEFAGFKQTFTMPPFVLADQFKITVTHNGVDPDALFGIPNNTLLSVGVNGEFKETPVVKTGFVTQSFCLGPRAYGDGPVGSPVEFQIGVIPGPNFPFFCGSDSQSTIEIDRVALELAEPGECPNPGTILNPDFELATDWTFEVEDGATGAIVAGVGENGTAGARLTTANVCSQASMTGTIAFPTEISNPALDVFFSGTFAGRLVLQIDGQNVATLNGSSPRHKRICLPEWTRGTTATMGFLLLRTTDSGCAATPLSQTFVVDNITIIDDQNCPAEVLADPGFELDSIGMGPEIGWGFTAGTVNDIPEGSNAEITNSGQRSGNSALRLTGSHECVGVGEAGADFTINVPAPEGAAGPAIKFFANVGNGNLKTTTRLALHPGPRFQEPGLRHDIAEVGVYQPQIMCLPPVTSGRRMTFRFSTGDSDGGGCGVPKYTEEVALIDDVEVTTDSSCPAE